MPPPAGSPCPVRRPPGVASAGRLLLEILQPPRLVRPKPTVLLLPAVIRLLGHTKLPHHLRHSLSSGQLDLGLEQLPDNLRRCKIFSSWHLSPSLRFNHPEILSLKVATFRGAGQCFYIPYGKSACSVRPLVRIGARALAYSSRILSANWIRLRSHASRSLAGVSPESTSAAS